MNVTMKNCFVLVLIANLVLSLEGNLWAQEQPQPPAAAFAIYITDKNLDSVFPYNKLYTASPTSKVDRSPSDMISDLSQFSLNPEPLLSDKDINVYDWTRQELILTKDASKRMFQLYGEFLIIEIDKLFVVVVNGKRLYAGAMMFKESPRYPEFPIILPRSENGICILSIRPSMFFAFGPYPGEPDQMKKYKAQVNLIQNPEVKQVFNEQGKLAGE